MLNLAFVFIVFPYKLARLFDIHLSGRSQLKAAIPLLQSFQASSNHNSVVLKADYEVHREPMMP